MTDTTKKTDMQLCIHQAVDEYFDDLEGEPARDLYKLFQHEVEKELFECVLKHTNSNQSKAAAFLGINRGTLRKKLMLYNLDK